MRKRSEVMLWLALAGVAFGWRRSVRLCHAPPRRLPVVQCAAVAELCKQRFGCAPGEARLVEEKLPAAPWFNLATANSRCDSLKDRLRLSEASLQAVVMARPAVLGLSYEDTVAPALRKLQIRLRMDDEQLHRVVVKLPQVLGYSYEANVEPTLDQLQSRLGLGERRRHVALVAQAEHLRVAEHELL